MAHEEGKEPQASANVAVASSEWCSIHLSLILFAATVVLVATYNL